MPFSALLVAQTAQAQSVGYEETLAAARAEQPMLEAGAFRIQARRDAAEAADELPDPRVRAGVMNLPVTGPAAFDPYAQLPTICSALWLLLLWWVGSPSAVGVAGSVQPFPLS